MSHELEVKEGEASFAYRKEGGAPWHRLGTAVSGHQTAEEMLRLSKGDYEVTLLPVKYITPNGVLLEWKTGSLRLALMTTAVLPRMKR